MSPLRRCLADLYQFGVGIARAFQKIIFGNLRKALQISHGILDGAFDESVNDEPMSCRI